MTGTVRLLSAALAIVCIAGLTACGGDGGKSAAASAAVSQTLLNASAPAEKLTTNQAACFGTGIVNAFGVDRTVADGFITKDLKPVKSLSLMLSTKDASTYADLYLKCADPRTEIKNALIARIAPRTSAAQRQLKTCLDKNLTSSLMRKALIAAASGDSGNATLTALFTACGQLG